MSTPDAVQVAAQAKINLRLRILAREDSGYHQIETLFLRIALADTIRIRRTPRERSLDVTGDVDLSAIGPAETNLAWRAAEAHARQTEWRGGFAIEIEKHIPIGGGLGGGSADAGGVIRAMNVMTTAPTKALALGATLGADVPFLASELPFAFAWGRGERMMSFPAPPVRELLLAVPPFGSNTAEAFARLDKRGDLFRALERRDVIPHDGLSDWTALTMLSGNDFEPALAPIHPELIALIDTLRGAAPQLAGMTGSGSTVFAVLDTGSRVVAMEEAIRTAGARMIRTQTSTHVEPVIPIE